MRLLCIDDEPGIGALIKGVAEKCGFTVQVASNANQIQDMYRQFAPDVIILDLNMPGVDGIEGLGALAAAKCTARIILVSGTAVNLLAAASRLGSGYKLDIVSTLAKPFRAKELREILRAQFQTGPATRD